MDTADWYEYCSTKEARGQSSCYEEWAAGIASDDELLTLIDTLPEEKRQPNLILASARSTGIEQETFSKFRGDFIKRWNDIRAIAMLRSTQTNEVGRCATLLPVLCELPQPLALLEVGASAGLCLYPDRYSYQFDDKLRVDPLQGPGAAMLRRATSGPVPFPHACRRSCGGQESTSTPWMSTTWIRCAGSKLWCGRSRKIEGAA